MLVWLTWFADKMGVGGRLDFRCGFPGRREVGGLDLEIRCVHVRVRRRTDRPDPGTCPRLLSRLLSVTVRGPVDGLFTPTRRFATRGF